MLNNIVNIFLTFIIYSFLGYILEVIYCSYSDKKIVNRGFLFGPLCPIYGFGSLLITLCLTKYYNDPLVVFVFGMIITSLIEYYTSYILEKFLHNKWWDYSKRKYNLNGRICLQNSFLFGIGSLIIIYLANPRITKFLKMFNYQVLFIVSIIIFILFLVDVTLSIMIAYNLRHKIIIAAELKDEKIKMVPVILKNKYNEQIARLKWTKNRLTKSFPNVQKNYSKELELINKWSLENKKKKKKTKAKKKVNRR